VGFDGTPDLAVHDHIRQRDPDACALNLEAVIPDHERGRLASSLVAVGDDALVGAWGTEIYRYRY
jgi:hypothetical protein